MAKDNKRKARLARKLDRRKARREPYAKVLIVCEGEKTEPFYFNELKDYYGLNSANIAIYGDCGSAPKSIYAYARQKYREAKDAGDPFDRVFCVFDKDSHSSYQQTVNDIASAKPEGVYQAITSVPCFEYWLMLHFNYSTQPYTDLPGSSACSQVCKQVREHISGYEKGRKGVFLHCVKWLDFAKDNAERALREARKNDTDNPSTRVHELVDFLQNIKK